MLLSFKQNVSIAFFVAKSDVLEIFDERNDIKILKKMIV